MDYKELKDENDKIRALAYWYESILDAIPFPITVTDENTNWTFVNKAVEKFLNVKREDIIGKPCSNWGAHICNTERCGITCAKHGVKQTYFSHEGSSYQVDVEILKDLEGTTAGFVEVVQDVTKLEQITRQKAEAESANLAKSAFLAKISHEVRTPMNAILGITETQLQNNKIPQDLRLALGKIYDSGYMLLSIINDLLDLSKIESNKMELVPVNYDVASLINDTIHLNIVRYDSKPLTLTLEVDENLPSALFGDELRIKQVLNNLLSNAFKYTDSGGITFSIMTEHTQQDDLIMLILRVKDTGMGMTKEQLEKLFDEYTRFNVEANRTTIGTGLGMAIANHLVQLMNGRIEVKSEVEKGTEFTVRLPQKIASSEVLGKEVADNLKQFHLGKSMQMRKAPQVTREYMPYGKVLVVDDVESNLYVAKGLLTPYGLTIETASSGFEAIKLVKGGNVYDIIFMDHFMPRMDGMEAVKNIRDLGYDRPIIALTANALTGQAEMFMEQGFDGFISKPIDIRQMNFTLNKLVRDKHSPEEIEAAKRYLEEQILDQTAQAAPQAKVDPLLAELFVRDAERASAVLETLYYKKNTYNDEDIQNYIVNIHAMKSALANIGEASLVDFAAKLEEAGREKDIAVMSVKTPQFLNALNMVIKKLKPAEDNTVIKMTEEDITYLKEKIAVIQKTCSSLDKKTAKNALAELRQKKWPRHVKEQLNAIAEHLLHSEFEEAAVEADFYQFF